MEQTVQNINNVCCIALLCSGNSQRLAPNTFNLLTIHIYVYLIARVKHLSCQ